MLVSLLHAWLSISIRADQIISGTIINIAAVGLTGYLIRLIITPNSPVGAGNFAPFTAPTAIVDLPVVGWIIATFLDQGPIAMSAVVLVIGLQILLFRSRWGLRTRAVGEHPKAAETVGIDVIRLRYRNVILGGVFAGLAGAYLSWSAALVPDGMTAGRGFIALAAVIVGRWTPLGAFGAALLFASSQALGQVDRLRPAERRSSATSCGDPRQFFDALPYIVTIVVLAGFVGRSIPPAADGQPYEREASRPDPATSATAPRASWTSQEGRAAVPVLDDAGIERSLRATRRIAVVGASANPARPSYGVFRYLAARLRVVPVNPNETRDRWACRAFPTLAEAVAATGPVRHRRRLPAARAVRAPRARRRSRSARGACGCSSGW